MLTNQVLSSNFMLIFAKQSWVHDGQRVTRIYVNLTLGCQDTLVWNWRRTTEPRTHNELKRLRQPENPSWWSIITDMSAGVIFIFMLSCCVLVKGFPGTLEMYFLTSCKIACKWKSVIIHSMQSEGYLTCLPVNLMARLIWKMGSFLQSKFRKK